jgi:hypothetical protein
MLNLKPRLHEMKPFLVFEMVIKQNSQFHMLSVYMYVVFILQQSCFFL